MQGLVVYGCLGFGVYKRFMGFSGFGFGFVV